MLLSCIGFYALRNVSLDLLFFMHYYHKGNLSKILHRIMFVDLLLFISFYLLVVLHIIDSFVLL